MPYRYPSEFRRKVLDLVAARGSVASVAADPGVSDQTICTWRRQELIDTGVEPDLATFEAAELRAAKRTIKVVNTELTVTRRANELLEERATSPRGGSKRWR